MKRGINRATAEELDAIPEWKGHGFEIVRYRQERGGFSDLRQLDEVPGFSGEIGGIDDRGSATGS